MSKEEFKASKAVLRKYSKGEALKKATEKAKNTLETYIVQTQSSLHDSETVHQVRNPILCSEISSS